MAAALRFAARKICGRALQPPPQPYLTTAVKEELRQLLPRIRHGKSSLRRFYSSGSPNLVNNKHGAKSVVNAAESSQFTSNAELATPPPLWSPRNSMFVPAVFGATILFGAVSFAILYVDARLYGGPLLKEMLGVKPADDSREKKNDQGSDGCAAPTK